MNEPATDVPPWATMSTGCVASIGPEELQNAINVTAVCLSYPHCFDRKFLACKVGPREIGSLLSARETARPVTTPSGNLRTNAYLATLGFGMYALASLGPSAFFIEGVSAGTSTMTDGFRGILASCSPPYSE